MIHLHMVWITKYRKKVLQGEVAHRVRDIIREICARENVDIIKGHVSKDHVHLFVSIPPQITISRLVQKLKGKSSYKVLNEFHHLRKQYWGRHFWANGYCVSTVGLDEEKIRRYVKWQIEKDKRIEQENLWK